MGSEMCIRDSLGPAADGALGGALARVRTGAQDALARSRLAARGGDGASEAARVGAADAAAHADDERCEKATRTLNAVQLRVKAIRCGATCGKRD